MIGGSGCTGIQRRLLNHQNRTRTTSAEVTTAIEASVSAVGPHEGISIWVSNIPPRYDRTARLRWLTMRTTVFRQKMAEEFGSVRAEMLVSDHVFSGLDGRTVEQALKAGVQAKQIWQVVCADFGIPAERR